MIVIFLLYIVLFYTDRPMFERVLVPLAYVEAGAQS